MTKLSEIYDVSQRVRSVQGDFTRATLKQFFTSKDYTDVPYSEKLTVLSVNEENDIYYYVVDSNGKFVIGD